MNKAVEVGQQTNINRAIHILQWYYGIEPYIVRLQDLVENNPEFFGAHWGDSKIQCAVEKLETLVESQKILIKLEDKS